MTDIDPKALALRVAIEATDRANFSEALRGRGFGQDKVQITVSAAEATHAPAQAGEPVAVPAAVELLPIFADGGIGARLSSAMHAYLKDYVFGLENGPDHEPTDFEREMLEDFLNGAVSDETVNVILQEAARAMLAAAPVPPPAESGEVDREKATDLKGEDPNECYDLGRRDGFEDAVQEIDVKTGGDGEYRWSDTPERNTPNPAAMIERIAARFKALASTPAPQPGGAVKVTDAMVETALRAYFPEDAVLSDAEFDERVEHIRDDMRAALTSALSALSPSPSGWDAGAFEAGAKATLKKVVDMLNADYGYAAACAVEGMPLPTQPAGEG